MSVSADQIIDRLDLSPHPEGGWYRQTWVAEGSGRPTGTCIYFLLKQHEVSHWHKIDAVEIWHYYAGSPLIISISETNSGPAVNNTLGNNLLSLDLPQIIILTCH